MAKTKKTKSSRMPKWLALQKFSGNKLLLFITAFVAFGIVVVLYSMAASALTTIEAESMQIGTASSKVVSDSLASGGQAVALYSNGAITSTFGISAAAGSISVRARGSQCDGSPIMTIAIDGAQVASVPISATTWTDYSSSASIPQGTHQLSIGFANDYRTTTCDRNLYIDKATVLSQETQYALQMSYKSDGSSSVDLNGQTVKGNIYVFTAPTTDTAQVDFYVDSDTSAYPYRTEKLAPFSLAGDVSKVLSPFDTTKLSDGSHTVTAVVTSTSGSKQTIKDTFTVQNNAVQLLFNGDFETADLAQWASNQSCPWGVTVVNDPVRAGKYAVKFTVSDTDTTSNCSAVPNTGNPRAQLVSKPLFRDGSEVYVGLSLFLPTGFSSSVPSSAALQFSELYGSPYGGGPTIGTYIAGDRTKLQISYKDSRGQLIYYSPWFAPTPNTFGVWQNYTLHVKFSPDKTVGYIELWYNGAKQTFTDTNGSKTQTLHMATLVKGVNWDGTSTGANSLYVNSYRKKGTIPGTVTFYQDQAKVGPTYDSVQP